MDKIIKKAITAFLAMAATHPVLATTTTPASDNSEKCYGIVKAGLNDCATATASCAGSSTKDKQADAFLFVPKGLCNKISGGNLKAETEKNPSSK